MDHPRPEKNTADPTFHFRIESLSHKQLVREDHSENHNAQAFHAPERLW